MEDARLLTGRGTYVDDITLPITASLSASDELSDATWLSSDSTVPPSPWNTWMTS